MKKLLLLFLLVSGFVYGQSSFDRWVPTTGTDTYATFITAFPGSYSNTQAYVKFGNTNTGAATININSLGPANIRYWDGNSWELLPASHIDINTVYKIAYNGSFFEMESFSSSTGGTVTNIATTSPITGGPITTTGTIAINDAAADGSTKGAASFTAADFDATAGNVSVDYTNGQASSGSTKGFLTSADWTTFNNKQATGLSWLLASGGALTGTNTLSGAFAVYISAGTLGVGHSSQTAAARFDVQGTATGSATFSIYGRNSGGARTGAFRDDGALILGSSSNGLISRTSDGSSVNVSGNGFLLLGDAENSGNISGWNIRSGSVANSSGTKGLMTLVTNFAPSTGTATWSDIKGQSIINQTGSSSGAVDLINYTPTLTSVLGPLSFITYNPTVTSVSGAHYGIRIVPVGTLSGYATSAPVSTLETARSFGTNTTATSTDITLDVSHYTVRVDASGASRTITLPAASGCTRRIYAVKKSDSSGNTVTVDADGAETIDGATTQVLTTQYSTVVIQSNGTSWDILSTF